MEGLHQAPKNLGFWIDEAAKIITLADDRTLIVRRFDDRRISAVHGDMSYVGPSNSNLAYASSTIKDCIATRQMRTCDRSDTVG
jgi:hypothetical protein